MNEKKPVRVAVRSGIVSFCCLWLTSVAIAGTPDYLARMAQITCPSAWEEWRGQVKSLQAGIPSYVQSLSKEAAEAKLDFKERDLISITVFLPSALAGKVGGFGLYSDCADLHEKLLTKPTTANLEEWRACVEAGYGREPLPEFIRFLFACYAKLIR